MLRVKRQQTVAETILGDPRLHLVGEFVKAAAARGDDQFVMGLAEHLKE